MAKGFCTGGCPTPENLAEYRAGRLGGGYFSDPEVREDACRLVESVANTGECTDGPEVEDFDETRIVRMCRHSAEMAISQIGDAMERSGESPDVIIRIESKRGNN